MTEEAAEKQLRKALATYTKVKGVKPSKVRDLVENVLADTFPVDDGPLIDRYAHCFYGLNQKSTVDEHFVRGYLSNVIDAARGKPGYVD